MGGRHRRTISNEILLEESGNEERYTNFVENFLESTGEPNILGKMDDFDPWRSFEEWRLGWFERWHFVFGQKYSISMTGLFRIFSSSKRYQNLSGFQFSGEGN